MIVVDQPDALAILELPESLVCEVSRREPLLDPESGKGKLIQEEGRQGGRIDLRAYWSYFRNMPLFLVTLFSILVSQGLTAGSKYWLSIWSEDKGQEFEHQTWRLEVLALLTVMFVVFLLVCVWTGARKAGSK